MHAAPTWWPTRRGNDLIGKRYRMGVLQRYGGPTAKARFTVEKGY
jgi:hypothetical protein